MKSLRTLTPAARTRRALILLLAAALAGCGFHLRGNGGTVLPEQWYSMYLISGNSNTELPRELRALFSASGIQWATERGEANYLLRLGPEQFNRRNLSINAEARAAEFELTMLCTFSVQDAEGNEVMPDTTASVVRQMENDPRNVVGKAEEIRILKGEMRTNLAQQILRRIGFFAASL